MTPRRTPTWRPDPDNSGGGEGPRWSDGFRRALSGSGGSFLDLSVPLFTLLGIRVRLHILFLFVEAGLLLDASAKGYFTWALIGTLATFGLVLIHEFGHCLACRWVKGDADEVLLWPLGGLAMCHPPHAWRANLITTLGGPAVHVVLFPILTLAVLACGGTLGTLALNPLNPSASLATLASREWWAKAVWVLYWKNIALFAFNMTLVMFPMDAGRVLQNLLWARMGYAKSMRIATLTGLVMAALVGLVGLTLQMNILFMIAVFSGFTCWTEYRRIQFMAAEGLEGEGEFGPSFAESLRPDPADERAAARAAKERAAREEQARKDQEELDRILAKIAKTGMASLTAAEKRWLERETEQRRTRG